MMRIKDGFIMKNVAGSNVVLPLGERRVELNGIITFNEVGAKVFNLLDGTNSVEEIVTIITKEYDVSRDVVEADVNVLIEKMRAQGLIED